MSPDPRQHLFFKLAEKKISKWRLNHEERLHFGILAGNQENRDKNRLIKYRLQGSKSFAAHRFIKGLRNWVVWTSDEKELRNGPCFKARVAEYG